MTQPLLQVEHLSKTFGETRVLTDADLQVRAGEIHGLLGQNGSGKSTLIKVLAGYHEADPGAVIRVAGEPLTRDAQRRRLAFVHQDLGLVASLSVLENLRVGRYQRRGAAPLSWETERRLAATALSRFGLAWDLDTPVRKLNELERALLAIVRAVSDIESDEADAKGVLVLDEPTVYLPVDGVRRLFDAMRDVAAQGHGVLFVSHQLDEVLEITDRVSVLRDGRLVASEATADLTEQHLVELILGRRPEALYPEREEAVAAQPHVRVERLSGGAVTDVSFAASASEVLGMTGLAGAGYEDIPYLLFGSIPAQAGNLHVGGTTIKLPGRRAGPNASIRSGIVLVPANRPRDAVAADLTVGENVALPVVRRFRRYGRLQRTALRAHVGEVVRRFDVRPPDLGKKMSAFSGGNQQKAVLGKWLQTDPRLLLLHEPTQGVDVGARSQIYGVIRDAADAGMTVLVFSADHEELAHICDRVLVFDRGRVVDERRGASLTPERLADAIYSLSSSLESASPS